MVSSPPQPVTRDRRATERSILDAAKQVLAEQGFGAFGVNAIARAAGCDKQLIYRYYGGLDGLVDAIGKDLSSLFEAELPTQGEIAPATYAEFVEHLILSLLDAFRRSDFLLRIAAWEVLDPTPVTRKLAAARGRALGAWVQKQRADIAVPSDRDTGAINATLIAAVQHLALSSRAVGEFSGVPLESERDWDRIRAVVGGMIRCGYDVA